jgi:hypothetical protein
MAKWQFSFVMDGKHFEHLMEMLVPLKIEDLEHKIVAGTPTKIRAGDKPAWQIVADMATDKPQPRAAFSGALHKAGFNNTAGIQQAITKRAVRKISVKGVAHLVRAK